MPRAILLQCPICNSVITYAGTMDDHAETELKASAKNHLSDHHHHLAENKAGIRKHQIAAEAAEITVSAAENDRLPEGEWQPASDTWLPDEVTLTEVNSNRHGSAGDLTSSQLNAQY